MEKSLPPETGIYMCSFKEIPCVGVMGSFLPTVVMTFIYSPVPSPFPFPPTRKKLLQLRFTGTLFKNCPQ
eukprot:4620009-Karenia_brevis.AAC.1